MFDLCFKSLTIFLLIILFLRGSRATDWTKNSGLAKILHRPVGSLGFPKSSNMGIYLALSIPLQDPTNFVSLSYFFEANYVLPDNGTLIPNHRKRRSPSFDRRTIYAVIESKFESAGLPGRECLLRSICETSKYPLEQNGILGDVIRVIFSPSSSGREEDTMGEEIFGAEIKGRYGNCLKYSRYCSRGLFELIKVFDV